MSRRNLALALALSIGVHALAAMTLGLSPGPWRSGIAPSLRLWLRPVSNPIGEARAEARFLRASESGIPGKKTQSGSSTPLVPRYYRNNEVDVQATPISRGPLIYPELAFVSRLEGAVRARVFISEDGKVESVEVVHVWPQPGVFEEAALEALRQVRYKPAEIGGERVKSQKLIEVKFNPREDEASKVD